jgi:APA family basic amino acid/polyamine antiporter
MNLFRRMPVQILLDRAGGEELHRHMGLWALVLLGVGGTIGSGIFVLTGTAAAQYAGPAIAISYLIAGAACLFAGLCYAELSSMIPVAGSAYTYAYAAMGEFVAWIIGWNLVLEYLFASSTVAVGWSGYFLQLAGAAHIHFPAALTTAPLTATGNGEWGLSGGIANLPAALALLFITAVLTLGVRKSTLFNALIVLLKVGVILLVIFFGFQHVNPANWRPFVPPNTGVFGDFGWSGVVRGAGVVFFAYVGFDMVSSSAQEVKNPSRTVPLALLITLGVVTALYVAMCLVQTGLAPYKELNVAYPVLVAIAHAGDAMPWWLTPLVGVGVVVGLLAAMFLGIYGQSRIFYAMGKDGLIPPIFARLNPKTRTPVFALWVVGCGSALVAAVVPIQLLGELVSIGTLMAFAIVCIGVLVLRKTHPDTPRAFRTPFVWPVALLGVGTCVGLMALLPPPTWIRLAVWLAIGLVIYFGYGARRSVLARKTG